ncbi:MAG TPA: hypothetical protein PLO41_08015 [Rubrivivax sp.]|nr:hypothetical protein [Rubrivivax sp.]
MSASALAQMGVCERLVVFEHHDGKRLTLAQRVALRRGLSAHRRFASAGSSERSSCEPRLGGSFDALHSLDEGPESVATWCFRDRILRNSCPGRSPILICNRVAMRAWRTMARWPLLCVVLRAMLRPVVWFARGTARAPEHRHVK